MQSDMATELFPTPVGPAMTTTRGLRSVAELGASEPDALPHSLPSMGSGRFMLRAVLKYRLVEDRSNDAAGRIRIECVPRMRKRAMKASILW